MSEKNSFNKNKKTDNTSKLSSLILRDIRLPPSSLAWESTDRKQNHGQLTNKGTTRTRYITLKAGIHESLLCPKKGYCSALANFVDITKNKNSGPIINNGQFGQNQSLHSPCTSNAGTEYSLSNNQSPQSNNSSNPLYMYNGPNFSNFNSSQSPLSPMVSPHNLSSSNNSSSSIKSPTTIISNYANNGQKLKNISIKNFDQNQRNLIKRKIHKNAIKTLGQQAQQPLIVSSDKDQINLKNETKKQTSTINNGNPRVVDIKNSGNLIINEKRKKNEKSIVKSEQQVVSSVSNNNADLQQTNKTTLHQKNYLNTKEKNLYNSSEKYIGNQNGVKKLSYTSPRENQNLEVNQGVSNSTSLDKTKSSNEKEDSHSDRQDRDSISHETDSNISQVTRCERVNPVDYTDKDQLNRLLNELSQLATGPTTGSHQVDLPIPSNLEKNYSQPEVQQLSSRDHSNAATSLRNLGTTEKINQFAERNLKNKLRVKSISESISSSNQSQLTQISSNVNNNNNNNHKFAFKIPVSKEKLVQRVNSSNALSNYGSEFRSIFGQAPPVSNVISQAQSQSNALYEGRRIRPNSNSAVGNEVQSQKTDISLAFSQNFVDGYPTNNNNNLPIETLEKPEDVIAKGTVKFLAKSLENSLDKYIKSKQKSISEPSLVPNSKEKILQTLNDSLDDKSGKSREQQESSINDNQKSNESYQPEIRILPHVVAKRSQLLSQQQKNFQQSSKSDQNLNIQQSFKNNDKATENSAVSAEIIKNSSNIVGLENSKNTLLLDENQNLHKKSQNQNYQPKNELYFPPKITLIVRPKDRISVTKTIRKVPFNADSSTCRSSSNLSLIQKMKYQGDQTKIPKFYFKNNNKNTANNKNQFDNKNSTANHDDIRSTSLPSTEVSKITIKIHEFFQSLQSHKGIVYKPDWKNLAAISSCPFYWKTLLARACSPSTEDEVRLTTILELPRTMSPSGGLTSSVGSQGSAASSSKDGYYTNKSNFGSQAASQISASSTGYSTVTNVNAVPVKEHIYCDIFEKIFSKYVDDHSRFVALIAVARQLRKPRDCSKTGNNNGQNTFPRSQQSSPGPMEKGGSHIRDRSNSFGSGVNPKPQANNQILELIPTLPREEEMHITFNDMVPLIQDVVEHHPGLSFLKSTPEFHSRYVHTVICRIFYTINRSWSGKISVNELRRSNFLKVLELLDYESDINQITDYFSYEHFYVIYCKFWELDMNHDLMIDKNDLMQYGNNCLTPLVIKRLIGEGSSSGSFIPGSMTSDCTKKAISLNSKQSKNPTNLLSLPGRKIRNAMSYREFVWLLLSDQDKKTDTSIEYWFRVMDYDGDGYISMYELELCYKEQMEMLQKLEIEPLPFEDILCQILDMVNPQMPDKISLMDLKKCRMAHVFFNTFLNTAKYLEYEQRDPFDEEEENDEELKLNLQNFQSQNNGITNYCDLCLEIIGSGNLLARQNFQNSQKNRCLRCRKELSQSQTILKASDWDRWAAEEYEKLILEDSNQTCSNTNSNKNAQIKTENKL